MRHPKTTFEKMNVQADEQSRGLRRCVQHAVTSKYSKTHKVFERCNGWVASSSVEDPVSRTSNDCRISTVCDVY